MPANSQRRRRGALALPTKSVLVVAICAVLAGVAASAARAVDASDCQSGVVTVPAGTPVVVRLSVSEPTRGFLSVYLNAQTTTITVDGVAVGDVSGLYGPMQAQPSGWTSVLTYMTGVLELPGDSVVVTLTTTLAHPLPKPSSNANPVSITCTIVAV